MPRIFITPTQLNGNIILIEGDDFHHLKNVRRSRTGDCISICTSEGKVHMATITRIDNGSMEAEITRSSDIKKDPIDLTLCVALLKGKSFDNLLRKAVEIGVSRILPVITERTVPDISDKKKNKNERWRKIISEASKQSLRSSVPVIDDVLSFNETVMKTNSSVKIIAHTGKEAGTLKETLPRVKMNHDVALLIGPEGGFSEDEIRLARQYSWMDLRFGFTCLKAETAATVLPSILVYEWSK